MSNTGARIMSVFAAVWCIAGIRTAMVASPLWYAVPVVITVVIVTAALHRSAESSPAPPNDGSRRARLVGIAIAIEGLLILVTVNVLINTGKQNWTVPVIAVIVGLHFLLLARWLPARLYYATGVLLIACGLLGFGISDVRYRILIVTVGAACVLWFTSVAVLMRAIRLRTDRAR
ncbi:MAG: hypothetical protein WB799_25065 [Candidatus Sulfotelmatobacter sp.]